MEEKYLFEETSRILENIPQQNRSRRLISWLVFVLSCALFIILGSIFWDAVFALIIFITILAHEIGHFAAFKICGCRNVSVMMLPFVGGVTMARDAKISSANRVFCALSGPIIGLLSAFAALIFFSSATAVNEAAPIIFVYYALIASFINLLNLFPAMPLDGGIVARELVTRNKTMFAVSGAAFIVLICAVVNWKIAAIAGVFIFATQMFSLKISACAQKLRKARISFCPLDVSRIRTLQAAMLDAGFSAAQTKNPSVLAATIAESEKKPATAFHTLLLLVVYALIIGFGMFTYTVARYIATQFEQIQAVKSENIDKPADVIIQPFGDVNMVMIEDVSAYLSNELGIVIAVLPPAKLPENCFNYRRSKYISERFYDDLVRNTFGNPRVKVNTVYIGIVDGSLYMESANLNFVFAQYYDASHAMIGIQDMRVMQNIDTLQNRFYKLLKRAIGITYYMYPQTQEDTIMRSPIMGLEDLDNLSPYYKNQIGDNANPK